VINLYNVVLNDTLDFKFVAVSERSITVESSGEIRIDLLKQRDGFFSEKAEDYNKKEQQKSGGGNSMIELYTIENYKFLELLNNFPKTAE